MPTMPQRAAGWRMEPPVSLPSAQSASPAATAAAEPPLDCRRAPCSRSHGLAVTWYAEFSVLEPMANSSRLVLPSMTTWSSHTWRTAVAV